MLSLRSLLGLPIAAAITVALFVLMQHLILNEGSIIGDGVDAEIIFPTYIISDYVPEIISDFWPTSLFRPLIKTPLPVPSMDSAIDIFSIRAGNVPIIDIASINEKFIFIPPYDLATMRLGRNSQRTPPSTLPLPVYKGWVLLEFDISPTGVVENAIVVDSGPDAKFDHSALNAISKWKYKPKVIDGKPVAQYGMQQLITY